MEVKLMRGMHSRLKRLEEKRPELYKERCRGCGQSGRIILEEHNNGVVIFKNYSGFRPCPLCHELKAYNSGPPYSWVVICHDQASGRHCRFCTGEEDSWSVGQNGESKETAARGNAGNCGGCPPA